MMSLYSCVIYQFVYSVAVDEPLKSMNKNACHCQIFAGYIHVYMYVQFLKMKDNVLRDLSFWYGIKNWISYIFKISTTKKLSVNGTMCRVKIKLYNLYILILEIIKGQVIL